MKSKNKTPEKLLVRDAVLIGDWEEVNGVPLSKITKRDDDVSLLDGLIIKGYETKFDRTNENGERYAPNCLDAFIDKYFVAHELNMVVDVQHSDDVDDQIGRVIYLETNSVGFYFVVYIPRAVARYEQIKTLVREGILQGFSKSGYATEWEYHYKENGEFDYVQFNEFSLLSVSLVTMPANAIKFESMGEPVKNKLQYYNRLAAEAAPVENKKKPSIFKH